jgi:hypothetical protein
MHLFQLWQSTHHVHFRTPSFVTPKRGERFVPKGAVELYILGVGDLKLEWE